MKFESQDWPDLRTRLGAVILCGGKSKRMGVDKTQMPFQGQTLLERVVSRVSQVAEQMVAIGGIDSFPHPMPPGVMFDRDQRPQCGAIEGIRVGLKRLAPLVPFAFVTSCDVPLLKPDLIRYLDQQIGTHQAVFPVDGSRVFGTAAIYRTDLHEAIEKRIELSQFRVSDLAYAFDAVKIDVEDLKAVDPDLDSLTNINSGEDYLALLARFDLECPPEIRAQLKPL